MNLLAEKSVYQFKAGIPGANPAFSFRCKDMGMECPFETSGDARHKVLKTFIDHAETYHDMPVLSADMLLKFQEALRK